MKFIKFFSTTYLFLFLLLNSSFAEIVKKSDIIIQGNKKISSNTVIELLNLNNNIADSKNLNKYQKKLFQSNFFRSVDLSYQNKKIFIKLIENPIVDYIFIEGIENKKLLSNVKDVLDLQENAVFSEAILNSDIKKISTLLSSLGYFKGIVDYKAVKPSKDKINIFFNITTNKKFLINDIFFIGDKKIKNSKLISLISSKPKSFFSFFSSSSTPSAERIDYDISLLKKYYLNSGYYNVQIPSGSIKIIDGSKVNIIFTINGGNQFLIKNTKIKDMSNILLDTDVEAINKILQPLQSEIYNLNFLKKIHNKISMYIDKNNLNANVTYNIEQFDTNNLDVVFNISENSKKTYIRNIIIKGNDLTEEKVLRNNIDFAEGDLLTKLKISNSIDNLKTTGFFKDVKIKENKINNSNNVDVEIKIKESPTGEIGAGVGVGSNGSNVSFNFKENNLLGKGLGFSVLGSFGTESVSANVFLTNPDFASSGNLLKTGFYVSKYENDTSGYENKIIGSSISTGFELFEDTTLNYGISLDVDDLVVSSDASSLIKSRNGKYFTNKFFYSVSEDRRDKKFKSEDGYIIGFGQDIAHVGSDVPYLKNRIFGSYYNKFNESFIGTIRYKVNSINSFESSKDIKLSDRLFLSDNDLRGFKLRSYGPKVEKDFIGGNYSYSTTFSSTVPNFLPESWKSSSSIFIDMGNVWGTDFEVSNEANKIRSSAGLGFSWFSPVGPVAISYAEPIQKSSSDEVEKFNFKLGGIF
jgi:outer membrane protein insertion porin family